MNNLRETILKFLEDGSYLQIGAIEIETLEIEPLELPEIETLGIEPISFFRR